MVSYLQDINCSFKRAYIFIVWKKTVNVMNCLFLSVSLIITAIAKQTSHQSKNESDVLQRFHFCSGLGYEHKAL
jgi:hypothetical protein